MSEIIDGRNLNQPEHSDATADFFAYASVITRGFKATYVDIDDGHRSRHKNFLAQTGLEPIDPAGQRPEGEANKHARYSLMASPEGTELLMIECLTPTGEVHTTVYYS